jgi:hypothetical protein
MPLRFVLDENLRGGPLWPAIQQHNLRSPYAIDATRVGDPADLALGTPDPDILLWTERNGRILISWDKSTLPAVLALHLQAGNHSPGIFLLRPGSTTAQVISTLELVAHAGDPHSYQDRIEYIP